LRDALSELIMTQNTLPVSPHRISKEVWISALCAAALAIAVRIPLMSQPGFASDMTQFVLWGGAASHNGVGALYSIRPDGKRIANYPPAYLHVLEGLAALHDAIAPANEEIGLYTIGEVNNQRTTPIARRAYFIFKIPAVLADAATSALLVVWLARRQRRQMAAVIGGIYAVLPAVWFNSTVWGQIDAIPTLLMLASLEAASRKRPMWMIVWATLAMLFKAQAAILIPVWAVVCARGFQEHRREVVNGLILAAMLVWITLWPVRGHLDGVWDAYAGAANYYPYTHLNGFSLWFWLDPIEKSQLHGNLNKYYIVDNTRGMLLLPPRLWGMILLGTAWIYTMVVLWRARAGDKALRWAAGALPLVFFCVSTQMHERYVFPVMALWAWGYRSSWTWWLGWMAVSAIAFINMAWVWPGVDGGIWGLARWLPHEVGRGILTGQCCALALGAVMVLQLVNGRRLRAD
jgi:dolichyl-phosphate-mannose-protein mannosyltransferase